MKGHTGTDSHNKLLHSVALIAANVHDSTTLLHLAAQARDPRLGQLGIQRSDRAYQGACPNALDFNHHKGARNHPLSKAEWVENTTKSKVRTKVEHAFLFIKCIFGFTKMRYRALMKNANRLIATYALVNLYMVLRKLLQLREETHAH